MQTGRYSSNIHLIPSTLEILGIDIGGSGIKGAIVNVEEGKTTTERFRVATPEPADPQRSAEIVQEIVQNFGWTGPVGCGFPAIVKNGVARTAANIPPDWIGVNVKALLEKQTGLPFSIINDADAAGIAEMRFGEGLNHSGIVILLTVGTGIGSAIFVEGRLLANTELGHLEFKGNISEKYASDRTRKKLGLSWLEWGNRFNEYLTYLERVFSPEVFIVGGGTSKYFAEYESAITVKAPVHPAKLLNSAGIVGAALAAAGPY